VRGNGESTVVERISGLCSGHQAEAQAERERVRASESLEPVRFERRTQPFVTPRRRQEEQPIISVPADAKPGDMIKVMPPATPLLPVVQSAP
jgi:hypothetical protein